MAAEDRGQHAFLFDLDGTLIENLAVWKIHRRIGMSGGLFVTALARELASELDRETLAELPRLTPMRQFDSVGALPGADTRDSIVVGDSGWDMLAAQRARALGIGLLSGGYGREELIYAGAFRVHEDPADALLHLDEVGVRRPR